MAYSRPGMSELTRVLGNFWTAVFERPVVRQNSPIREVITQSDNVQLIQDDFGVDFNIPSLALYYEDLDQTGTDQLPSEASAWGADASNYMEIPGDPSAWLEPDNFWIAFRIRPDWDFNTAPDATMPIFQWSESTNIISVYFDESANEWRARRFAVTAAVAGNSHSADDDLTIIARFNAAGVAISLNGGAFVQEAEVSGTALAGGIVLGADGSTLGASAGFHWVMIGQSDLTNDEAADLHDLGNTDPTWSTTPNFHDINPVFLWPGVDNTHTPTATYGESSYVDES